MYESSCKVDRFIPDSLERRPAKIKGLELCGRDIGLYFAAIKKDGISIGKIKRVSHEIGNVTIETGGEFLTLPHSTEFWTYFRPFVVTAQGIGVKE